MAIRVLGARPLPDRVSVPALHPANAGPYARLLDIRVVPEPAPGYYELVLEADERHERNGGILHGGVMMSILDMAMAGAVVQTLQPHETCVSVNINTDFLRAATRGRLVARARLERRGKTMAFPQGELLDAEGGIVARATGVWAIRGGEK